MISRPRNTYKEVVSSTLPPKPVIEVQYDVSLEEGNGNGNGEDYDGQHPALKKYGTFNNNNNNNNQNGLGNNYQRSPFKSFIQTTTTRIKQKNWERDKVFHLIILLKK